MNILSNINFLKLSELRNESIGQWPPVIHYFLFLCALFLTLGLGYKSYIAIINEELSKAQQQEVSLKESFALRAFNIAQLEEHKKQLIEIENTLSRMVNLLPSTAEIPAVLEEITREGIERGLIFEEIKSMPENLHKFYAELPIRVKVEGDYHNLAIFLTKVESMQRIITLHDFSLKPVEGETERLLLEVVMKTYRYTDQGSSL